MWSLDYLSISVSSKGWYKTTPPSPNIVKSFIQIPQQGQVTRTKNKKTIIVDKNEILTRETQPHMKPWVDIIRENVICLGGHKDHTRSDHGKKRPRESNASSSFTTLNHPSSSHPLDDTIDANDEESFHYNSSSPSQNISSTFNVVPRVRQNPPHESHNLNTYLFETIYLQTQQRDAHREGLSSIRQAHKNMMSGKQNSYTKGWMSFIKRSDAAPICYSKPLDSIKNWNDHFFWVDSTAFPLIVSLKSKILSKDPLAKLSRYDAKACEFLRTITSPFWKFPEPFLCWVGISRYYTLDENSYPTFWDGEEGGEQNLADREVKLFKMTEGRTVLLNPPVTAAPADSGDSIDKMFDEGNDANQERSVGKDDDVLEEVVALDASEVSAEKAKKKQKRKMTEGVSGFVYPPKKLRDDHQSLPPPTGGKSLLSLYGMVPKGSVIPSDAIKPLVTASVTPMSDVGPVDYVFGLNLRTRPPHVRYVVSSNSSHYSGSYSETASLVRSVANVLVVTVVVTTTIDSNVATGPKAKDAPKDFEHIGDYVSLRTMDFDQLYSKFNVGVARQVCVRAKRRSLLSLKEAKVVEAISLHSQLSMVEAADAAKGTELRDLKEKNFALEGEKNVVNLTADLFGFQLSRDELNSKVAYLESERDCLATQKNSLDDRVTAIDFDLMEMVLHMDAEFYPCYLTSIARRRWILSRGLRLVLAKCLSSPEYLSTMGEAIGRAIDKGKQDGLAMGIEHGIAERSITDVVAFNPFAKGDYIAAINGLQGPAAETSEASQLQPSLDQLMIPIHRLEDHVIILETSLSFSLEVAHNHVQRLRGDAAARRLSLMDSVLSLVEPLSARNLTGEASSSADFTTPVTTALLTYLVPAALSTEVPSSLKVANVPCPWKSVSIAVPKLVCSFDQCFRDLIRSFPFGPKLSSIFRPACFIAPVLMVSIPVSTGITASVPQVSENGVSPFLDLIMVNSIPFEFVIIKPAPEPSMHDDPSVNNTYGSGSSFGSSIGVSNVSSSGRSMMKSARIYPFTDILGHPHILPNIDQSVFGRPCPPGVDILHGYSACAQLCVAVPQSYPLASKQIYQGCGIYGPETIMHSSGIILLLHNVTIPPITRNFNIPWVVDGIARILLIPDLPIIPLWGGDLTTMKSIHAEVECSSSPIFTSNDICPNGHIISLLNPTSGVAAGIN
nr:hypothetical protein [Tanacetum cinerariifolium]